MAWINCFRLKPAQALPRSRGIERCHADHRYSARGYSDFLSLSSAVRLKATPANSGSLRPLLRKKNNAYIKIAFEKGSIPSIYEIGITRPKVVLGEEYQNCKEAGEIKTIACQRGFESLGDMKLATLVGGVKFLLQGRRSRQVICAPISAANIACSLQGAATQVPSII